MNRARLLVVDDDVDFADSLADVLDTRGFQVKLAHSGEECLRMVQAEAFAKVVLDMKMPGMNGLECLIALRRIRPGIPVVLVTAFSRSEMIRQALEMGTIVVLDKADAPAALLETIALLAGGCALLLVQDDPALARALSGVLAGAGYRVEVAETPQAAMVVISGQEVDLVVLDERPAEPPEADLLAWLQAREIRTPVVAIADAPHPRLSQWPWLSPKDVLVKPFRPEALLGALARGESRPGELPTAIEDSRP